MRSLLWIVDKREPLDLRSVRGGSPLSKTCAHVGGKINELTTAHALFQTLTSFLSLALAVLFVEPERLVQLVKTLGPPVANFGSSTWLKRTAKICSGLIAPVPPRDVRRSPSSHSRRNRRTLPRTLGRESGRRGRDRIRRTRPQDHQELVLYLVASSAAAEVQELGRSSAVQAALAQRRFMEGRRSR